MKKIYISPSDQTENIYAYGGTNEAEQCRRMAKSLVTALRRCGFEAKTNTTWDGPDAMAKRIAESNAWGAVLHICLHTNAFNKLVMGTRMFCNSFDGPGYLICKAIAEELMPITPGTSDNITEYPGLAEIRKVAAVTAYIEVGFHDSVEEAAWIIANTDAVAEHICKGVCAYYKVAYIPPTVVRLHPRYNRVEDVPAYGQSTVKKLLDKQLLLGKDNGRLDLSEDMLRILVVQDRAGVFG